LQLGHAAFGRFEELARAVGGNCEEVSAGVRRAEIFGLLLQGVAIVVDAE
jgi:hypothetical protein